MKRWTVILSLVLACLVLQGCACFDKATETPKCPKPNIEAPKPVEVPKEPLPTWESSPTITVPKMEPKPYPHLYYWVAIGVESIALVVCGLWIYKLRRKAA